MSSAMLPIQDFAAVKTLIQEARRKAMASVDAVTIDLYWNTGIFVRDRLKSAAWGDGVVRKLAEWLAKEEPGLIGFSSRNIHRMVKFVETYTAPDFLKCVSNLMGSKKVAQLSPLLEKSTETKALPEKVSTLSSLLQDNENQFLTFVATLLRQISWSNHLLILSGKKSPEERLYYLLLAQKERLGYRDLKRQIQSSMYERTLTGELQKPESLKNLPQETGMIFRDTYSLELLGLPALHDEKDVRRGIVSHLKDFFLEFGRDFCFVGEEYKLQVGGGDYFLDLLFYHRELRCLVGIELKAREFDPRDLGQLEFYLEALDRDIKKDWENPSIGILLCKEKDDAVVEYSLSRSASPAMIAEYTRILPQKALLQARLQELLDQAEELPEE
ncbi:MAG: PDDEXK nuclease domain-containing protein [Victivallales bacterium]